MLRQRRQGSQYEQVPRGARRQPGEVDRHHAAVFLGRQVAKPLGDLRSSGIH